MTDQNATKEDASGQSASNAGLDEAEVILRCNAVNGKIDMCIGFKTLKFAAENHPYFWDGKSGMDVPNINITDAAIFAKEVAHAINDEAEDGSTLLTRMLDEAIKNAVESGCDGVALDG